MHQSDRGVKPSVDCAGLSAATENRPMIAVMVDTYLTMNLLLLSSLVLRGILGTIGCKKPPQKIPGNNTAQPPPMKKPGFYAGASDWFKKLLQKHLIKNFVGKQNNIANSKQFNRQFNSIAKKQLKKQKKYRSQCQFKLQFNSKESSIENCSIRFDSIQFNNH